jgi:molybdenum cofactor cytidylyltransferase
MSKIGAILLAAGASRRYGAQNKLLSEFGGRPMVRVVAESVIGSASLEEIVVVTGFDRESVEQSLEGLPVRFAYNAEWQDGMGRSIAIGMSKISASLDGAAIVPGDIPFLTSALLYRLISSFDEFAGKSIVFPVTAAGDQRNPVIWPRHFFGRLRVLKGREGGKTLLSDLSEFCFAVPVESEDELLDIDEPGVHSTAPGK